MQIWTYERLIKNSIVFSEKEQISRIISSTKYNMHEELNEQHYLEEYFHQIDKFLPELNREGNLNILDLGCGQGRFIHRFLRKYPNANITGIDVSEEVIQYNTKQFLENNRIQFITGNYSENLDSIPDNYFDIVVFTEVSFFYPRWKNDFATILDKLKTNGQIIFSTRSSYFNVISQIGVGNIRDALRISESEEGNIAISDPMQFSWNSSRQLVEFFENHKTKILSVTGIGVCSGIKGDPFAEIIIPSELTITDRNSLRIIENRFSTLIPDAGRYILVIAEKV